MVIIDIYGRIEKTKISDKLKIFISNVPDDWKEGIKEDILMEIRQQKTDSLMDLKNRVNSYETEYSVSYLREIIHENIEDYSDYYLDTIENCIQCLVDNMICLFFDYENEDMPFFDWTTNCFDGRLCEEDYAEKVMNFINFIHNQLPKEIHMNCIYSSNEITMEKSRILLNLSFRLRSELNEWKSKANSISKLQEVGNQIDDFISSENDYYKLDYIMNALYKGNDYNQNHFFKSFSLLEMILLQQNQKTENIDIILQPFLEDVYKEDSALVAKLLRQMRNKIGHADFKGFNDKTDIFAQKFMTHYNFDYTEYSRLNWVLLHACCLLDDVLRKALLQKLKSNQNAD